MMLSNIFSQGALKNSLQINSYKIFRSAYGTKADKKGGGDKKSKQTTMPPCDINPRKYEGPDVATIKKIRANKLMPMGLYYKEPILLHQGYMQYVFDHTGKRYLDLFAGISTVNIGHCHPKLVKRLYKDIATVHHISNSYLHEYYHTYADRILDRLGGKFKKFYLNNTGSESHEIAMLLARLYTRNKDIIVLHNSNHGGSHSVRDLTSIAANKFMEPESRGVVHAMLPDPYKGLWGGKKCRNSPVQVKHRTCSCKGDSCCATDYYYNQLEEVFKNSIPKTGVAAMVIETIQANGVNQLTKGYIQKAAELVRAKGGIIIVDELFTGFGRTGALFNFPSECVEPEIVVMGKGMGSGMTMSGLATTEKVGNAIFESCHCTTFGANAAVTAASEITLDILEKDKLIENAKEVGTHFLKGLEAMMKIFPYIGDVRGKGLMIGVELIDCVNCGDQVKRTPMTTSSFLNIWEYLKNYGILFGRTGVNGNVLTITPPLCITKSDADFAMHILSEALYEHADRLLAAEKK